MLPFKKSFRDNYRSRYDAYHNCHGDEWVKLTRGASRFRAAQRTWASCRYRRDGYTRGSHYCSDVRATILAHRPKHSRLNRRR